jgi:hypothetical protein
MVTDARTGTGVPVAWAIHSLDDGATFTKILDHVAHACGEEFTPAVLLVDCCNKELNGFEGSQWAKRGTMVGLCYFHFKRAWADSLREYIKGDPITREEMLADMDKIVHAKARRHILVITFVRPVITVAMFL